MNEQFTSELLHEVKVSSKRWFIIAMIEIVIIAVLTLMLIIVPTDEYSVEQESDNASTNIVGGDYYGGETESNVQEA